MVATADCVEKPKAITGHKVSKPLMEKKRRARINKCLDQLKTLLESYYSSNIRKRKLEKADILELTVKHLRSLQKIQSCAAAASDLSDFQSGFRSCLANVNQYLAAADTLSGGDRWLLSRLSGELGRSRGRAEASSTMDSGAGPAEERGDARRLLPAPEEGNTARCKALKTPGAGCRRAGAGAGAEQGSGGHRKRLHSVGRGDEAADAARSVWRPW